MYTPSRVTAILPFVEQPPVSSTACCSALAAGRASTQLDGDQAGPVLAWPAHVTLLYV
jgi:hypothetical protein